MAAHICSYQQENLESHVPTDSFWDILKIIMSWHFLLFFFFFLFYIAVFGEGMFLLSERFRTQQEKTFLNKLQSA